MKKILLKIEKGFFKFVHVGFFAWVIYSCFSVSIELDKWAVAMEQADRIGQIVAGVEHADRLIAKCCLDN